MSDNVLIAIVTSIATAGSTALVAIVAIIQNNKRFDSIERQLATIQSDLKEFFRELNRHSIEIELLKKR